MQVLLDVINYYRTVIDTTESKRLNSDTLQDASNVKKSKAIRNSSSDTILYCLLYLDGLIMINIDLIKKIDEAASLNGKYLSDLLREVLYSQFLEDSLKEVASHILAADLSMVKPETEPLNNIVDLLTWTYNYYQTK